MSKVNVVWLKDGRILRQIEDSVNIVETLPKKVYTMGIDPASSEIYLEEFADDFKFNFKIYGMETQLIKHIMKTFHSTTSNLGILFNGMKGTGKTITAKLIANEMNLPVIIVDKPFKGLTEFISKINCPCILFFDEYEKNFRANSNEDASLLSLMDGVYNSPARRIFLLTTNNLYVNENMIGRPSRIRYRKSFGNLSPEVVQEYLEDNLKDKKHTKDILEFIDTLAISTIDILKSIVDELNIHDVPISTFKSFLNVENAKFSWSVKMKIQHDDDEEIDKVGFKKLLNSIGTKAKNENGKEYTITEGSLGIYQRRVNTSSNVLFMQVGNEFGSWGNIVESIDGDGILVTEDDYGTRYYIKVLNIDTKPSLYRGGLAF